MNPFVELFKEPLAALNVLGWLGLFGFMLIVSAYIFWSNLVAIYDGYEQGGWDIANPPLGWTLRVAAVPLTVGIDAWLLGAIIYVLG